MSPFTSIKDLARDVAGVVGQSLINERFRNIDLMSKVECPTFFIHGQEDKLISPEHSEKLSAACSGEADLHKPKNMNHNEFDFIDDLVHPFHTFL
mmetsp:Transcript_28486/g.20578  ORF Transcript_28486/g.20578 Transcript_28486/m.20578 type:complete len:95 (+) Transcript_28486:975-1259(+)